MLRRWDDSQRFLAAMPQLICEETANYLILWCMSLQQEGVICRQSRPGVTLLLHYSQHLIK